MNNNIPSLFCDNPECEHVEFVAEITQDMVNKPCPECGSNLLTQEDYDVWVNEGVMELLENTKVFDMEGLSLDIVNVRYHNGNVELTVVNPVAQLAENAVFTMKLAGAVMDFFKEREPELFEEFLKEMKNETPGN